jgi:hypothetical protein
MGCEKYSLCAYPIVMGRELKNQGDFICMADDVDHTNCRYFENPPTTREELFERVGDNDGLEKTVIEKT